MSSPSQPPPTGAGDAPGDARSLAALYAKAKALREAEERNKLARARADAILASQGKGPKPQQKPRELSAAEKRSLVLGKVFQRSWAWTVGFFAWWLFVSCVGTYFFTRGFLLTRLVLEEKSACGEVPGGEGLSAVGRGGAENGCWAEKSFDKAVVLVIDALRYDFTVPQDNSTGQVLQCHNALPVLHESVLAHPENAFLLPFIADPPTTTLQRLKGLTTGTLPTFMEAGSNFAGTAIEEDNLLMQLKDQGKRIVHLGDDTWTALFPGYFEPQLSHAYDSFNVWDLHTVDEGVIEHIHPLLKEKKGEWDVLIGHFLGVDHAGHRYGPDHPAMKAKLQQMDKVIREVVESLDDDTLLVVMGDHGMDSKGDHGGESDDEVEAALWMYSRKGIFGRTDPKDLFPPATAKERAVNQIDLVPTLSLLLGVPIPFNNLGHPIEAAFAGRAGNNWGRLADVAAVTAAGIKRYQSAYFKARGVEESGGTKDLWERAQNAMHAAGVATKKAAKEEYVRKAYGLFAEYQHKTLEECKAMWARFDVTSMGLGIGILVGSLLALISFARNVTRESEPEDAIIDEKLEEAEKKLAEQGVQPDVEVDEDEKKEDFTRSTVQGAGIGALAGVAMGITGAMVDADTTITNGALLCSAIGSLLGAFAAQIGSKLPFRNPLPTNIWSIVSLLFPTLLAAGFGSNSYTIWEDKTLLFFLTTLGVLFLAASLKVEDKTQRILGITQSCLFIMLGWGSSWSTLCREEQMPFCSSTFYSSSTSSTSAPWSLVIPWLIAALLPDIIKSYLKGTKSYEGFAPLFIGVGLRMGLVLNALYWTLDVADDAEWITSLPAGSLKAIRVSIARTVIGLGWVVGPVAWSRAPPCVKISTTVETVDEGSQQATSRSEPAEPVNGQAAIATRITAPQAPRKKTTITILGFSNAHGSLYLLLLSSLLLPLLLLQKPMGALALSLAFWQILSLAELLDVLDLRSSPVAAVSLALLGQLAYFKTGHQATLASLQWDAAFVPFYDVIYPWSPLMVVANTLAGPILSTLSLPLLVSWKVEARQQPRRLAGEVGRMMAWYLLVWGGWAGVSAGMAGHLRRHLMLYRVFSPRWMLGALEAGFVGLLGVVVVGWAVWRGEGSVGGVFGWE
jgi:phosphatidylinositol glycan class O